MKISRFITAGAAALVISAAGLASAATAVSAAPAPLTAGACFLAHPGFTGTWRDTSNGQYLGAVGNPQRPDSSASVKFTPQSGTETENCFDMTHPAAYSVHNGALVQWSNAGRNHFGKYLACSPFSTQLTFTNAAGPVNGPTDWVYDGFGFQCMGRYLVLAPSGGVIGSAYTSANPAAESPIEFVTAS